MIAALLAAAACGVASAQAEFETPAVQYYERGRRSIACLRATGKPTTLGYSANDGMGTDESLSFNGVVGNRWAWTTVRGSYAESADSRVEQIFDLHTGKLRNVTVEDEDTAGDAVVLPGALVAATNKGVEVTMIGRRQVLSSASATAPAAVGSRVYWREDGVARTALLQLPPAEPAGKAPRARTIVGCKPKPGARLLLREGVFVISRAGGDTWACRRGKTRRLTRGAVTEFSVVGERSVAYARPGFVGVLDVVSGTRRELASAGGALAADHRALYSGGPEGLKRWMLNSTTPITLSSESVSEVAVGVGEAAVVYWLDGTGTPHSAEPVS